MRLEKAIEISSTYIITRNATLDPDVKVAFSRLIEAGKRIKFYRDRDWYEVGKLLPGETEE